MTIHLKVTTGLSRIIIAEKVDSRELRMQMISTSALSNHTRRMLKREQTPNRNFLRRRSRKRPQRKKRRMKRKSPTIMIKRIRILSRKAREATRRRP